MTTIDFDHLAVVTGGAQIPDTNAFGRCGPGTSWKFLGNVYTPECKCHDAAVRRAEMAGTPHWLAQVQALPKLPAAIGSYVKAKLTGT